MNNFPENENIQEVEESTIFSDPAVHRQIKVKNGNKKRVIIVIAALLAVSVLTSSIFLAKKFMPKKPTESASSPTVPEIEVLNQDADQYKTVTVKNENGTFDFYSLVTKAQDEESEDTVGWYMQGFDKEVVSSYTIFSQVISNFGELKANREITEKSATECGLDNPKIKADIVKNDGAEFSVLIGDQSADKSSVYLKLSTKDNIYLVSNQIYEDLNFVALDMANTDAYAGLSLDSSYSDYTEDGNLVTFDSITVSGNNFEQNVVIVPNKDEVTSQFTPYLITSPQERVANNNSSSQDEAGLVDSLISLFSSGFSPSGAYSFDVTSQSVKAVGLDKPDFAVTIKLKNLKCTYKFKLQSDGDYAVMSDSDKMIRRISADTLKFLSYTTTDFYANWVFIDSIDSMSNLTVKIKDKTYSMDIKKNPDSEDEENPYIVTYDGKQLKCDDFQTFYRFCISFKCTDFTVGNYNTSEDISITFNYNDEKVEPVVIAFKKATATKYQYTINGEALGKINSSEYNLIEKYLGQLIKGETVTYN